MKTAAPTLPSAPPDAEEQARRQGELRSDALTDAAAARFELTDRAAAIGIWDWDLRSNTFAYSETARAICGLPAGNEPFDYSDIARITHPDDLPHVAALAQRALDPAIRERVSYEYRVVRPGGALR